MAIVMKYGAPGPILQAAYAAGVGSRMNKEKDDALKVWSQQNQQQFQAQQSWLDRAQRAGMQQQAFTQQSQLQKDAFAQQNKYAEDQRTFQAAQNQEEMGFRSTQAGRARQYQAEQQSANDTRDFYTRTFFSLPQIPEFADGDQRKSLTNTRSAIQGLLTQGFDTSRPEVREKLDEQFSAYNSGITALQESYSPASQANRNTFYRDKQGIAYDTQDETGSRIPYDLKTGKPLNDDSDSIAESKVRNKFTDSVVSEYEKLRVEPDENDPDKRRYTDDEARKLALEKRIASEATRQWVNQATSSPAASPAPVAAAPPGQPAQAPAPQASTAVAAAPAQAARDASRPPEFKDDADRERWRQQMIKWGYGDPDAPATPQASTAGPSSPQSPAAATYTDPKSGEVFEKRGNTWVQVK